VYGCELRHFRCVWYRDCIPEQGGSATLQAIQTFDNTQLDRYIAFAQQAEPEQDWQEHQIDRRKAEAQQGWYYYVAFDQEVPIATASLYKTNELGYLAEAYTHPDHRRHGAHTRLIHRRIQHAGHLGCCGVFSVTDSHTQSARDLQRMGFMLAYNYLLFVRSPMSTLLQR
jgi:GNAT superfamily N-acetyltransferase